VSNDKDKEYIALKGIDEKDILLLDKVVAGDKEAFEALKTSLKKKSDASKKVVPPVKIEVTPPTTETEDDTEFKKFILEKEKFQKN
jgi:DNA mismatch repair ATPase MutL